MLAVTLAMAGMAVMAGMAGVTGAPSAQAATLGFVQVKSVGTAPDQQLSTAWKILWRDAYDTCRQQFPRTKSVQMTSAIFSGPNPPYTVRAYWNCRDTP